MELRIQFVGSGVPSPKHPTGMFWMGSPFGRRNRLVGLFLSFFYRKKKGNERKMLPPEGVPPSAEGGRGSAPGPRPPLERVDGNFTGLRPCFAKESAVPQSLVAFLFASFSFPVKRKRSGGWGETPDQPKPACYLLGSKAFRRRALVTTETLERLIAAAATMGFRSGPPKRYKSPAATGIPRVL